MMTNDDMIARLYLQPMTVEERAFVLSYVLDYNFSRACKEVSISPRKGRETLRKPAVQEFMQTLQNEVFNYRVVTEDWVFRRGMELFLQLTGEEDIPDGLVKNEDGEEVILYRRKFYAETAVKLWTELAKMTKAYEEGSNPNDSAIVSLADAFRHVHEKTKT